jgi:hypothetical protein
MAKEWTDEEIAAEIKRCHDIVREDKDRASYTTLHERFGKTETDTEEQTEGGPPPKKNTKEEGIPKKKRSIWWGELSD